MSDKSKLRRDSETHYPKYDRITEYDDGHSHEWGGYSKNTGKYYEGGHGENTSSDSKKSSGSLFKKRRGD